MPEPRLHYGAPAKLFHWAVAALIAVQLPLGWLMPDIHRGMTPGVAMSVHISIGMTILVLIVLRFLWRLTHPVAPESGLPAWQRVSSELVYWLLYLAVLLTTLSGWFFASMRGWTIYLYGVAPLPHLVAETPARPCARALARDAELGAARPGHNPYRGRVAAPVRLPRPRHAAHIAGGRHGQSTRSGLNGTGNGICACGPVPLRGAMRSRRRRKNCRNPVPSPS